MTEAQKAKVRHYLGWAARFHQTDTRLEMAMSAVELLPDEEAFITNALNASPPGYLAALDDISAKLAASHARFKAEQVGSIKLNRSEYKMLRSEGRRIAGQLAAKLGVEVRHDVFSGAGPGSIAGWGGPIGGGNYVGK